MRGLEQIPWLYDGAMRLMPRLDAWRRELVARAGGRVLEIGCGTGLTLRHYPSGVDVIGLEPEAASLARARRRMPEVPLVRGNAEHLPFAADTFDTVVSSLVFCSVENTARGLAEIRRVLRPSGQLLMLEHVQAENRLGARLLDLAQPPWTALTGGCRPNRDTEAAVRAAGFSIEHAAYRASGLFRRFIARPVGSRSGAGDD